jgi:signal transduction histidine kinase
MRFDHVWAALRSRRFLLSSWPWRSLGYLLTTVPFAAVLGLGVVVVVTPWIVVGRSLSGGDMPQGGVAIAAILVTLIAIIAAPVIAVPLAALERGRLRMVDERPIASPRRIRIRYLEAATWRAVAYTLLLGSVVPAAYGVLGLFALLDVMAIVSPFLVGQPGGPISIGITQVTSAGQAVPYAIGGLILLPLVPYLIGVFAAVQAALARALLSESSKAVREVASSRARLVDSYETERRRIERDLHDGAQHLLTSLTLHIGTARLDTPADSPAAPALDKAHEQAKDLMVMLRNLIHGIRPQTLTDLGIAGAARELAHQSPVPITVTVGPEADGRYADRVESTAYFALAEALTNVTRHAQATRADVTISRDGPVLVIEVRDDGRGGADQTGGTGLTGLADRVATVNGRLLLSSPAGGPTLVRVELPCE